MENTKNIKVGGGIMETETWAVIPECPEYEVSTGGGIRRGNRVKKPARKANGYLQVVLYHDRKPHHRNVHRLVASVFVPNPDHKPCVNHIDGVKSNNRPSNLEWVTHHENTQHGITAGLLTVGSDRYNSKLTSEDVCEILTSPDMRLRELAERYSVSISTIWNIRHGVSWKHVAR